MVEDENTELDSILCLVLTLVCLYQRIVFLSQQSHTLVFSYCLQTLNSLVMSNIQVKNLDLKSHFEDGRVTRSALRHGQV